MIASLKNITPLILYLFGSIIIIFLSLRGKIHLSLLLLIPLFPLRNVIERLHNYPMGNKFIDFMLIAIILGWLFKAISNREKIFTSTPLNKILFIMVIYTYISLWLGSLYLKFPAPISVSDIRLQSWKNYMIFPLLYFIIVNNINNIKQIKWLIFAMIISIIIMDYYTLNQIKFMSGLASREKINGTFVWLGVNEVAAFYVHYIFILLGIFFIYKHRLYKLILLGAIIIGLYITLFLYSRGAYLGLIGGFLTLALIKKRILILPLILILIFWRTILPMQVVERINQTKTEEGILESSSQHRIDLWKQSADLIKENPIIGAGFSTVPFLGFFGGFADTHNIYIKTLVEQGIIGFIILVILFWLSLKNGWRLYKKANDNFLKGLGLGFTACVISTMVTNFFGDRWTYLQLGAYYWVFLGLVARGNIITQAELHSKIHVKKK